jgi:hypothetical protein
MLNFNKNGLLIFDQWEVDRNLPKYKNRKKTHAEMFMEHMTQKNAPSEDSGDNESMSSDEFERQRAAAFPPRNVGDELPTTRDGLLGSGGVSFNSGTSFVVYNTGTAITNSAATFGNPIVVSGIVTPPVEVQKPPEPPKKVADMTLKVDGCPGCDPKLRAAELEAQKKAQSWIDRWLKNPLPPLPEPEHSHELHLKATPDPKPPEPEVKEVIKAKMTVEEFFATLGTTAEEIAIAKERGLGYKQALESARDNGQKALVETLMSALGVVECETRLLTLGLKKFLTEDTVVKFYKEVEKDGKGLALTWIKNFARLIPHEVTEAKRKADAKGVFDNYVVMHYDPAGKAAQLTQQEIERKKDPILFGLIAGSRKLYYLGDWKDELCDLTLDQIADRLGMDKTVDPPVVKDPNVVKEIPTHSVQV